MNPISIAFHTAFTHALEQWVFELRTKKVRGKEFDKIVFTNKDCVKKSWPQFWTFLADY